MCGIVGLAMIDGEVDAAAVDAARDRLFHRGPDGSGDYLSDDKRVGLGFRRLSIIDLSAAGSQPMTNEDRSVWLVFNGEIFNFPALRRQLIRRGHAFASATDSEVLLHLYEEEGPELVQSLVGMFAFAIWDERAQRVTLVRDRLGIKPLYYAWDGRRLLFASELKSIARWPGFEPQVAPDALGDYLTYGYVPHDRCMLAGVKKLPAAHVLTLELRAGAHPRVEAYWDLEYAAGATSKSEAIAGVRERLATAVSEQLVSDVPLGLFLSGGIDSTSVLAYMSRCSSEPVRSYGIGFDDPARTSELPYAQLASDTFGAELTTRVLGEDDAETALRLLSSVYDEPLLDYSTIPTYHVSALAADHVKVVLSGDGGDEVFGGYGRYTDHLRAEERRHRSRGGAPLAASALAAILPALRHLPYVTRLAILQRTLYRDPEEGYFRHVGLFDPWEQRRLLGGAVWGEVADRDPLWLLRKFLRSDAPTLWGLRYLDLKTYLPDDILVKVDRASMSHSLEVRPALLDHRLVEYAFALDDDLVVADGRGKHALREAVRGVVPPEILTRSKKGFGSPVRHWLRGTLGRDLVESLDTWTIVEAGLIRPSFVRSFMRNVTFNRWAKLWSLIVLESWHREWVVGDA
jgi:asparagine synthase (glutamine-hydrolysing)